MNKQQIELAVSTGLAILGPKSDLNIPVKHNEGVYLLRGLLTALMQGQIALASPDPLQKEPGDQPPKNPTPNGPSPSRSKKK